MGALATALQTRHNHHLRLIHSRGTTDQLFELLHDDAFYERPIAERHRIIFYLGHVEAFDWNLLGQRAFGLRQFNPAFDRLFAFGIDPLDGGLPTDQPSDWPSRDEIIAYGFAKVNGPKGSRDDLERRNPISRGTRTTGPVGGSLPERRISR